MDMMDNIVFSKSVAVCTSPIPLVMQSADAEEHPLL